MAGTAPFCVFGIGRLMAAPAPLRSVVLRAGVVAPHGKGNTRQFHHVPTPTRAGGEKMLDRTTAFPCSAGGVSCGRCWSTTGA